MKALVVTAKEKMTLMEIPKPELQVNEVLVKVAYCGICGSDLPRFFEGAVHQFPQVLGHEFSGVVSQVGDGVNQLKVGARVSVAPLIPCGNCEQCQQGNPTICSNYSFIGSRQQGALAEFIAVPAVNCLEIPDSLDLIQAALIEPLTVAIHGIERILIRAGERVMVLGAGTIGLLTLLALNAKGVGQVIMVDINEQKLALAKRLGATVCINPNKERLSEYFRGHQRARAVIETAGNFLTQQQAVEFVEKKGSVVFVGTSVNDVTYSPNVFEQILRGELTLTGAWMSYSAPFPGYEWEAAIHYLASGIIDVKPLVSGIYELTDLALPFKKMIAVEEGQVKLLYRVGEA